MSFCSRCFSSTTFCSHHLSMFACDIAAFASSSAGWLALSASREACNFLSWSPPCWSGASFASPASPLGFLPPFREGLVDLSPPFVTAFLPSSNAFWAISAGALASHILQANLEAQVSKVLQCLHFQYGVRIPAQTLPHKPSTNAAEPWFLGGTMSCPLPWCLLRRSLAASTFTSHRCSERFVRNLRCQAGDGAQRCVFRHPFVVTGKCPGVKRVQHAAMKRRFLHLERQQSLQYRLNKKGCAFC